MNKNNNKSASDEKALKLKVLAEGKEVVRRKLAVTAKKLAVTAREKEVVRRKLAVTAKKLAVTAREKEVVRRKLGVVAKEKEDVRRKLVITAKELAVTARELAVTARELAVTAKEKEGVRRKLEVTAKKLATTAKDKETVRRKLVITADALATTAKEKEIVRRKLAVTAEDLEQVRAKNEAMLASIGEGVVAVDKDKRILLVNKTFERLLGWKEEEVQGKLMSKVIPMVDESGKEIPAAERLITKTIRKSVVTKDGEEYTAPKTTTIAGIYYYIRKDKTKFPVAVTVAPIRLGNKTIGTIEIFRDITRENEIEKTRRDLLSLASHQLRTPLSGTKWLIETLQRGTKGPISEDQKEYLDEIYKINEQMTALVVDMLGVLRMEDNTVLAKKTLVSTTTILDTIFKTYDPVAKSKQLTLRIVKDRELTIQTDLLFLQNILASLVSNAINYSRIGGEVLVSVKKVSRLLKQAKGLKSKSPDSPTELIFAVKDSGIGIPVEERGRLFERFYRASNAKTFDKKGTGLGLYIATTLAKKIGATISFESEEDKGSTFYVHVPYSGKV